MIKLVQCIHAKPGLSPQEFRTQFERYGKLLHDSLEPVGAVELELTVTLAVQANAELMISRSTGEPFDAMVEIWWPSAMALEEALAKPEGAQALENVRELQEELIDFSRSVFFFAYQLADDD
ncbi:MAG: EthD domain-containing protein [Acidobacteria bacterium]|nr:EthD domain-containing protein [Acidobacteriota bacterium]